MGIDSGRSESTAIDLSPEHLELVQSLLQSHLPGVAIWAYGSRVRGNAREYSDLDLAAFTTPEQTSRLHDLRQAFEDSDLPFRVDLFAWDEIPVSFHSQIRQHYAVVQRGDDSPATFGVSTNAAPD